MTALVGILNKRAAVIAADSAVTITNGDNRTIINTAKKIFRLSNSNPVGVMIYSSADFMDIPWEVLIKLYRDKNSGKSFDTLQEYVDDFIYFLRHNKNCIDKDAQANYLDLHAELFFNKIKSYYNYKLKMVKDDSDNQEQVITECMDYAFNTFADYCKEGGSGSEFDGYKLQQFRTYAKEALNTLKNLCKDNKMPSSPMRWEKGLFNYITSNYYLRHTGVVFVGYGNDEIYPSLISLQISGFVDDRLRFFIDEDASDTINNKNLSYVAPFAQTDVMTSLLKGMHPYMYDIVMRNHEEAMNNVKKQMITAMKDAGVREKLIDKFSKFDLTPYIEQFGEKIEENTYNCFSSDIVEAVASFNIEDMVKMAESMISITNLQRHISSSEESVGGPVDVAVITKSEGFVWINYKHWFEQNMNPQVFRP